jgi:hypothetical protein
MTTKADPEVRVVGSSSDGCQIVLLTASGHCEEINVGEIAEDRVS